MCDTYLFALLYYVLNSLSMYLGGYVGFICSHCCFLFFGLVQKQSDELAHASGEHAEAGSNVGNKAVLLSKGTNNVAHQLSSANSSDVVYANEFDTSVSMLNIVCSLDVEDIC